jgi:hypothetical protein
LTVTTEQGACLPEIAAGEQWLFYLRRDDKSKGLLLGYGSPSAPIADAEPIIAILRRLAAMTVPGLSGEISFVMLKTQRQMVQSRTYASP